MSHNLKTLKIVAPSDGDLLLPTNYGKPGRLNTMGAIRSESARIYRRVCEGRIPVEDGTKLFYILDRMTRDAITFDRGSQLDAITFDRGSQLIAVDLKGIPITFPVDGYKITVFSATTYQAEIQVSK